GEALARRLAEEEGRRPFDLGRGPLLRAMLMKLGAEDQVLMVTMHHIVSDGWSMGVLVREFTELYGAREEGGRPRLEELGEECGEWGVWQREWLQGEVLEKQMGYWREQLAGLETLELGTDRVRPAVASHRGGIWRFAIDEEKTGRLRELSREEGVTLYMTLL